MTLSNTRWPGDGPRPTPSRRGAFYLVAMGLLLAIAFGIYGVTNAEADLIRGASTSEAPYAVSLVSQPASEDDAAGSSASQSVADVAERANAAVVTVYTFLEGDSTSGASPPFESGDESEDGATPLGAGSGWVLTGDGYVVTNAHVVQGADSFVVQYYDDTQLEAELVGTDVYQDVAVLKLVLGAGESVPGVATVGNSEAIRPGDEVVAIGSPLGEFTNTVSDGTIGGLDRALDTGNGSSLPNLIQHDAEISPGNSGGPLLNMQGEVIGMNVAKVETTGANGVSASGLNFAIDGNTAVAIAETIIANNGSIVFPYLGIQTRVSESGAEVMAVEPDGPAAVAGFEAGDVVVAIDGVAVDNDTGLTDALFAHEPGDTVSITVTRDGGDVELEVTLGERPEGA